MNKFLVLKGNHSNIVKEALLKRKNWEEVSILLFYFLTFVVSRRSLRWPFIL